MDSRRWVVKLRLGRYVMILGTLLAFVVLAAPAVGQALRPGQVAPEISGEKWINSPPLTMTGLRGRVVLVEFWTYG
jgi:hypothetical protein